MFEFFWDYIVVFLIVLTILVFVHELGHYVLARRNGVRIEVFSIGFGPEIYGWNDSAGTRWKISAVPLGGYVKMFGELGAAGGAEDQRPMTPEEQAVSFHHKRLGQRAAIVAAGPIANFLFAFVVLAGLFSIVGLPLPLAVVGEVQPESAASEAGLRPGDRILSINGQTIVWFSDLRRIVRENPAVRVDILIRRDGVDLSLQATPTGHKFVDDQGMEVEYGLLGVMPDPEQVEYERQNPFKATWMAVERSLGLATQIFSSVSQMITGSRSTEDLGGVIRIAQFSGQMCQDPVNCIFFLAALSVNLGLINLFPIPVLDGGYLAFYAFEAILRRPLDPRAQEYGFRFGIVLVFLLMIFATWNDLVYLKVFEFIKQLFT
ncbi:MAG: RIP metalloprotease RseP [Rhodospirillales bacterium]|jgi:regulator of sigma E protease|nr:RIP metalloprotease RseP [Rhodospirillales bacterium]HIJ42479.1 RIP metalloprotease RseP [Rhodospirillaceae bacterium]MDP7098106.1 RIP metalloprotease RseP [Rhodospirillales bacterium]MDP7216080.1 RIP metalloprotease RseP [Rhodospirillales bacterium]HIJ44689.1 RIP metalloprotease RseP [Rhodospirillaceae bacterium]